MEIGRREEASLSVEEECGKIWACGGKKALSASTFGNSRDLSPLTRDCYFMHSEDWQFNPSPLFHLTATSSDLYDNATAPAKQVLQLVAAYQQAIQKTFSDRVATPAQGAYSSASKQFEDLKAQNAYVARATKVVEDLQAQLASTVEGISGRSKQEGDAAARKAQGYSNAIFAEVSHQSSLETFAMERETFEGNGKKVEISGLAFILAHETFSCPKTFFFQLFHIRKLENRLFKTHTSTFGRASWLTPPSSLPLFHLFPSPARPCSWIRFSTPSRGKQAFATSHCHFLRDLREALQGSSWRFSPSVNSFHQRLDLRSWAISSSSSKGNRSPRIINLCCSSSQRNSINEKDEISETTKRNSFPMILFK